MPKINSSNACNGAYKELGPFKIISSGIHFNQQELLDVDQISSPIHHGMLIQTQPVILDNPENKLDELFKELSNTI